LGEGNIKRGEEGRRDLKVRGNLQTHSAKTDFQIARVLGERSHKKSCGGRKDRLRGPRVKEQAMHDSTVQN